MLQSLLYLIRVLALHRISILQILASGTIRRLSRNNPVRAAAQQLSHHEEAPRGRLPGLCGTLPIWPWGRVSKQATGNKENYKRVENLIREVLRKSESLSRAQVGWRCNLVMHLALVGILKFHVKSRDAGYLCLREVYVLKSFCLLLQNLLGAREIEQHITKHFTTSKRLGIFLFRTTKPFGFIVFQI